MGVASEITGEIVKTERPDWRPLEGILSVELVCSFMWMHEVKATCGLRIHAYKHSMTRRYLHIDANGNGFAWIDENRYRRVDLADLLEEVFRPLWRAPASAEEVLATWAAIARARC